MNCSTHEATCLVHALTHILCICKQINILSTIMNLVESNAINNYDHLIMLLPTLAMVTLILSGTISGVWILMHVQILSINPALPLTMSAMI